MYRKLYHITYLNITILSLFFLGNSVLIFLGWKIGMENVPSYQKIFPQFYPLLLLSLINLQKTKYIYTKKKIQLLIFISLLIGILIITNKASGLAFVINTLLLPVLLSLAIENNNSLDRRNILRIILFFFLVNAGIAFFEKIIHINLFPFTGSLQQDIANSAYSDLEFRSTALQNHPLNNSLIMTIIFSFILIADFKEKTKFLLFLIGYLSILFFNTRSSMILWIVVYGFYNLRSAFAGRKLASLRLQLIIYLVLGGIAVLLLFFYMGLGERLFNNGLIDNSTLQRINVFQIFSMYSFSDLLFGYSKVELADAYSKLNLFHIENYWIIYLFRFGLLFSFGLVVYYWRFLSLVLGNYSKFDKIFVLVIFMLLSSSNNSLAGHTIAISVFILCSNAFIPKGQRNN